MREPRDPLPKPNPNDAPPPPSPPASAAGDDAVDEEAFRFVTIRAVATPSGCVGSDWLVYRISQGPNLITGYRRGDLRTASAEVEKIVFALNERRLAPKGRRGPKPGKPATPVTAPEPEGSGE